MTAYATIRGTLCAWIELSSQLGRVFVKLRPLKIHDRSNNGSLHEIILLVKRTIRGNELRVSFICNGDPR